MVERGFRRVSAHQSSWDVHEINYVAFGWELGLTILKYKNKNFATILFQCVLDNREMQKDNCKDSNLYLAADEALVMRAKATERV